MQYMYLVQYQCYLTESYSFMVRDRTGDIRPVFIFVTTEIKCINIKAIIQV